MRAAIIAAARRGPARPPEAAAQPAARLPELSLRADDVDVWRARLDDQPAEAMRLMQALLAPDEIARARSFFFDRDRRRYVVGRGILRILVGRYLAVAPHEVTFVYGPNGKPALAPRATATSPLFFNVAHSEGVALYAFTRVGEIGIDLELIRDLPDWEQVAEAAFSTHELAQLRACAPERRREEFFRAWARQEAVLKALGTGLGGATKAGAETGFNVYPLDGGAGFAAALAVGPGARQPTQILRWRGGNISHSQNDGPSAAPSPGDATPQANLS